MSESKRKYSFSDKLKCIRLFIPLRSEETPLEKKIEILNMITTVTDIFVELLQTKQEIRFQVLKTLRQLLQDKHSSLRTLSCRVLRKCMISDNILSHIETLHIHYFLIRCLEQRSEYGLERVEALKFFYHWIQLDCKLIPKSFVLSLVAISESENDPMRISCLLTLCEIAIKNPKTTSMCGGISLICKMCIDPKLEQIQSVLLRCILNMLNSPEKKQYLSDQDLNIILSPFISLFEKTYTKKRFVQFKLSKNAIETLLKDWSGLIFLAHNPNGLKAFLTTLKLPSKKAKIFAIEMLYKLFFLEMPQRKIEKGIYRAVYPNKKSNQIKSSKNIWGNIDSIFPLKRSLRHNLIDNYLSVLLVSFMDIGLFEALVDVGKGDNKTISFYVAHFLSEILYKSRDILSSRLCTILQSLPSLFEIAATFSQNKYNRIRASKLLSELDRFARKKKKKSPKAFHISLIVSRMRKYQTEEEETFETTSKKIIEEMKSRKDKALIDQEFENKIKESKVISTDDYSKWNFRIITDLLIITKNNKKYFDNCLKNKFFKNLLNFFDPKSQQFCNIERNFESLGYVSVGVKLIELLLNTDLSEGFDFLKNSNFLSSLDEALRIESEGASNNKTGMKRLFTPSRMSKTLTKEYFTLIGTFTTNKRGLNLLINTNILNTLQNIVETKGRGDLALPIITSFDYNYSDITRKLLANVLNLGSKLSRLQVIEHLKLLWRAGVNGFSEWAIPILVSQLHDKDQDIVSAALDLLDECCSISSKSFDSLVSCQPPDLEKFGVKGKNLLICVLSTTKGLKYLKEIGYLDKQLVYWEKKGCIDYVKDLEHYLTAIFHIKSFSNTNYNTNNLNKFNNKEVYLPPHFFGELVKTKQGIQILTKRKLISKWFSILNNFYDNNKNKHKENTKEPKTHLQKDTNNNDQDNSNENDKVNNEKNDNGNKTEYSKNIIIDPIEIRAILWAIGNISTSNLGYSLIKKSKPVKLISNIASTTTILSIRGTCLYVLGLIASTSLGRKKLKNCGWEFPVGKGRMIVLPKSNLKKKFFSFPSAKYAGSFAKNSTLNITLNFIGTNIEKEIFSNISDLANKITEETATKNLLKIKSENSDNLFNQPYLFYRSYKMLEYYHFNLRSRKLIHHLFQNIYFEEDIIDKFSNEWLIANPNIKKNNINSLLNNQTNLNSDDNNSQNTNNGNKNNLVDLSSLFEFNENSEKKNVLINKTHKIYYSLERLRTIPRPEGVNSRNILDFLKDDDFMKAFSVNKEQFFKLPKWKQIHKRKEWGLN